MQSNEELTIEDIVNLKSSCSKKVFDNFIEQKYANKAKSKDEDESKPKKKSKADRDFEKVFGCERNKEYKPTIDRRMLDTDKEESERIDEEDRPEEMTAKYRPRKFREIFKVEESNVSVLSFDFSKSVCSLKPPGLIDLHFPTHTMNRKSCAIRGSRRALATLIRPDSISPMRS